MSYNVLILCYLGCVGLAWSQSETDSGSCYAQQISRTNIAERLDEMKATLEVIAEKVLGEYQ